MVCSGCVGHEFSGMERGAGAESGVAGSGLRHRSWLMSTEQRRFALRVTFDREDFAAWFSSGTEFGSRYTRYDADRGLCAMNNVGTPSV